jgi:hypothetical protein
MKNIKAKLNNDSNLLSKIKEVSELKERKAKIKDSLEK